MQYIFFGHVNPSFKRVSLNIKNPPLQLTIDSSVGRFKYSLQLNNTSDIVIVVETEKEIVDISTLSNLVKFFTQSLYDTALLQSGVICSVSFTSVYLPNQSLGQINPYDISNWMPTNIFDFQTEELFRLANDPVVRIAIADIRMACIEPDLTALFSFRAIEDIMQSFGQDQKQSNESNWKNLRERLNIGRKLIDPVTELSKSNRHGEPREYSSSQRRQCIQSAMITLQRYLHYIKGGRVKLDNQIFPEIQNITELQKSY